MGQLCRLTTAPDSGSATLEVARESLEMSDREDFVAECRALLATGQPHLIIDLRGLQRVFSVFFGTIMNVNERARTAGQRLTVRASWPVAEVLRAVAGSTLMEIDDGLTEAERKQKRTGSWRP